MKQLSLSKCWKSNDFMVSNEKLKFCYRNIDINKDENVHRFAFSSRRGELLERERGGEKERERERERARESNKNIKCDKKCGQKSVT